MLDIYIPIIYRIYFDKEEIKELDNYDFYLHNILIYNFI